MFLGTRNRRENDMPKIPRPAKIFKIWQTDQGGWCCNSRTNAKIVHCGTTPTEAVERRAKFETEYCAWVADLYKKVRDT